MTLYILTERERDCRRLLDDARELVARLEKIADLAANFLDRLPPQRRERGHVEGLRWTREKWMERRHNIQAMIEQAIDEALNLALAFGS